MEPENGIGRVVNIIPRLTIGFYWTRNLLPARLLGWSKRVLSVCIDGCQWRAQVSILYGANPRKRFLHCLLFLDKYLTFQKFYSSLTFFFYLILEKFWLDSKPPFFFSFFFIFPYELIYKIYRFNCNIFNNIKKYYNIL